MRKPSSLHPASRRLVAVPLVALAMLFAGAAFAWADEGPSLEDLLNQAAAKARSDAQRHAAEVAEKEAQIEALRVALEAAKQGEDAPPPAEVARDIRVIARWNVVPHQGVVGPSNIGVVAFHMAGIDRVEFDWDDDPEPEAIATEASLNPRTGVVEYWITLDPTNLPPGPFAVEATVHPNVGIPRTLAGPLNADTVHNGNHGLPLVSGATTAVAPTVTAVGPDRTHKTIADALNAFGNGNVGGQVIELDAGTYAFGGARHPYATTDDRWLTIRPAPGVARADVRIVKGSAFRASKVRLHNLTLIGEEVVVGRPEDAVWLDDCDGIGSGIETNGGTITASAGRPMVYVTGGTYGHNRNGIRYAVFTRGVTIDKIGGVAFGGGFVVNSRALAYDNGDTDFHGDVWHWFESKDDPRTTENVILYGLDVERWPTQGIYVEEPNRGSKAGQYLPTLGSLALVDVAIDSAGGVADAIVLSAGVGYLHMQDVRLTGDISYRRGEWGPQWISNVTAARWLDNVYPAESVVRRLRLTHPDQSQSVIDATATTPS